MTWTPQTFRAELLRVPLFERDAWVDACLGLGLPPDDGPALPPGGVPYLPCPVEALLQAVTLAQVGPRDVVVDIGSGVGRAAAFLHLLTGAEALGLEIQPQLVHEARAMVSRLALGKVSFVEADAPTRPEVLARGTVFLLYCPFSGERLERLLDAIQGCLPGRDVRLCCVDLSLPSRRWLTRDVDAPGGVELYRAAVDVPRLPEERR